MNRRYYWDFFGPRAVPTAQHFRRHLEQFLAQHGVADLPITEQSQSASHYAIGLETPEAHQDLVERALKPRRSE